MKGNCQGSALWGLVATEMTNFGFNFDEGFLELENFKNVFRMEASGRDKLQ